MIDERRKIPRELHGNQNYLNFIKKNHLYLKEEINSMGNNLSCPNNKIDLHSSGNFNLNTRDNSGNEGYIKPINSSRVIHDSLSKFQLGNSPHSQISNIYKIDKSNTILYDQNNNTIYEDVIQKNNEIAANLIKSRTKHAKHEAAKELLFHLNKNKSSEHKKLEFRSVTIDRYSSIPEPTTELHLKFPIIEKKISETISDQAHSMKINSHEGLRQRLKFIEKKQRSGNNQQERSLDPRDKNEKTTPESRMKDEKTREIESKFKMREELYGLLPSFKIPNPHQELLKKGKNLNSLKNKARIQRFSQPPLKDMLEEYLEKNVLVKCSSISIQRSNKEFNAIINGQNFNQPQFGKSQDAVQLIEDLSPILFKPIDKIDSNQKSADEQTQELRQEGAKQVIEQKMKVKKQAVTQLKYEGELSIYQLKMRHYRQFLFMLNLAHRIFDPINLKEFNSLKPENKYRFHLGKGNNYLLVKSLLKRRFWWTVEEDAKKANFLWTQLKVNYFYQFQKKAYPNQKDHKLDKDFEVVSPNSQKKKKKKQTQIKPNPVKAGIYRAPLPPNDKKIFTLSDKKYYDEFLQKADNPEKLLKFSNRLKYFEQNFFKERTEDISNQRVHNHLQFNYFIGNKKALFYNLKQYYDLQKKDVFQVIPLTYHIKNGSSDPQYESFTKQFKRLAKEKNTKNGVKNIWIVKPGELSNRGQGITVIEEIYQLNNILKKKQKHFNGVQKTYIIQKYIEKPLLYKSRKFDIRHYMMISRLHGVMRAYWFGEGYIRTSSSDYNIEDVGDQMIHLTNDAIQKYSQGYGKYEEGNKVSYNEFQRYMDSTYGEGKFNFSEMIYPNMKSIALDAIKATYLQLDPNNTEHNFQIFGLDFMIDCNYKVWLIEVNTNPCLQLSSKLLSRIIPTMLQQTLRLTLDVIFPPPTHYPNSQKYLAPDNPLQRLQFQLIFDEDRDGKEIRQLYANAKTLDMGEVDQQDETYQNDGNEIELDNQLD